MERGSQLVAHIREEERFGRARLLGSRPALFEFEICRFEGYLFASEFSLPLGSALALAMQRVEKCRRDASEQDNHQLLNRRLLVDRDGDDNPYGERDGAADEDARLLRRIGAG